MATAALPLEIDQMDAVTAFYKEIYMEQPKEFTVDPTRVCRPTKAMYGLKQSSRVPISSWIRPPRIPSRAVESGWMPSFQDWRRQIAALDCVRGRFFTVQQQQEAGDGLEKVHVRTIPYEGPRRGEVVLGPVE